MQRSRFGVALAAVLWIGTGASPATAESDNELRPRVQLVSSTSSGRTTQFRLRITNWQAFPLESLKGPALPPNPCRMQNAPERLWLEVFREDGQRASCLPVNARVVESFLFRDYDGSRPDVFVVLTDIKDGRSWKSSPVATSKR